MAGILETYQSREVELVIQANTMPNPLIQAVSILSARLNEEYGATVISGQNLMKCSV